MTLRINKSISSPNEPLMTFVYHAVIVIIIRYNLAINIFSGNEMFGCDMEGD